MKLKSVLLIDDNDVDNFIHRRVIDLVGFSDQVHACTSVRGAKEFLNNLIQSKSDFPEVIFLDLNMPGENGFDFLDWFKSLTFDTVSQPQIVILTSSNNNSDIQKAQYFNNVVKFITKPLRKEDLTELATI